MAGEQTKGHLEKQVEALGKPQMPILDFSSLFNPLGPPPGIEDLLTKLDKNATHPTFSYELRKSLAQDLGLEEAWILPIPDRLWALRETAKVLQLKEALLPQPTSKECTKALKASGCRLKEFTAGPDRVFKLCLGEMAWQVEEDTDLAFLCNPNSFTGYYMPEDEVEALARWCKDRGSLLVVDETFLPFTEKKGVVSHVPNYPNLMVLRDLSYVLNLPGIPISYMVAQPKIIETLLSRLSHQSLNPLSQEVSLASLREKEFIRESRNLLKKEKTFLTRKMIEMGFPVFSWTTPYFLFQGALDLKERLLESGILIEKWSPSPEAGLAYYRVLPKTRAENQKLIEALASLNNRPPSPSPRKAEPGPSRLPGDGDSEKSAPSRA